MLHCVFQYRSTSDASSLSLLDALPISDPSPARLEVRGVHFEVDRTLSPSGLFQGEQSGRVARLDIQLPELAPLVLSRSEEHTSELQSRENLVCRLLLEKKKNVSEYAFR